MIVNNGKYRRTEFYFEKEVNGSLVFSEGFPLTVSFLSPFAQYPEISEEELSAMTDLNYQIRLNDFYQYLNIQYSFFNSVEHVPNLQNQAINSNGTDLDSCPIDLAPEFYPLVRLSVEYFQMSDGLEAIIKVQSIDQAGNPVIVNNDRYIDFILKQSGISTTPIWDLIEGEIKSVAMLSGTSESVIVPRFRYRGVETDLIYKSVFVQLFSGVNSDDFRLTGPTKVSITLNKSAFLVNFISTLAESHQNQLTVAQIGELINTRIGELTLGKSNYKFDFQTNVPQRPVFIYPISWGLLESIVYLQGNQSDILAGGAFILNNELPLEIAININGSSINHYVYSAKNLIIYPKRAVYQFNFSVT